MDLGLGLLARMHTHRDTHTNTQLASHPSDHTRFQTYIKSTGLAAIKDDEKIAIHVPCQRKHTTRADDPRPNLNHKPFARKVHKKLDGHLIKRAQTIAPETPPSFL